MSELDDAFAVAEQVHKDAEMDDPTYGFNFLTLEALGRYPSGSDGATWAASFDAGLDDEWYELRRITKYPTATRSNSPATAILGAAEKFYKVTGRTTRRDP